MAPQKTPRSVWLLLTSLYATQYLGLGFLLTGLVAILREGGQPLGTLGLVYMIGMAWPLKVLWAPLVDRVQFGRLGRFRGWLILTQGGLVVSLVVLSVLHPLHDLNAVLMVAAAVSMFSATQDTAVNGLVCLILPPSDRGPAKSLHNAGHLLGVMLGGGLLLMAYEQWGWRASMLILAAGTGVSVLQLLVYREPDHICHVQHAPGLSALMEPFRLPQGCTWLLLVLALPINVSMGYALMTPLLVDAGWSLRGVGLLVNVLGPAAGIASALVTGRLLQRYARRTMLIATALLQVPCTLGLLLPTLHIGEAMGAAGSIALIYLLYQPAQTAVMTAMMDRAGPVHPAASFTMQSSLQMLAGMIAMTFAAPLAAHIGYVGVILVAAGAGLFAVAIAVHFQPGVAGAVEKAAGHNPHEA